MDLSHTTRSTVPSFASPAVSPVASERVCALARRIIEGAPALSPGEMRELADAILEHNARSEEHDRVC